MKPDLSARDQLRVAYFHFVCGVEQQLLAHIFEVNSGRINEACKKIGSLLGLTEPGYKQE
jgi:hypothetical protein